MAESQDESRSEEKPRTETDAEWDEMRRLLLGQEQDELAALHERLENPTLHARDVSEVLPQAVELSTSKSDNLSRAITPAVESALQESVQRDPSILINAIFPVIGPAIRKAIAEALARTVQSMNKTLEHSLSWRSLRWRLEAARTGRSFAEVVLCHTLVYRVEQVFLIHRETGLLLQHVALPEVGVEDTDMVSGMFTAIQDFVRDSFGMSQQESLLAMHVGELAVWVEAGPHAYLAAVIRGTAPETLRLRLQSSLEELHLEMGPALEGFDGNAGSCQDARPGLENCLEAQYGQQKAGSPWKLVVLLLLVTGVAGWWVWGRVQQNRRWSAYLERLQNEPGLIVTQAGRRAGDFYVTGLRDPSAPDPQQLGLDAGLDPDRIQGHWEPYWALTPDLVLQRVGRKLQPPEGVVLEWGEDRVLRAVGAAPQSWIDQARAQAAYLQGIDEFDLSGVQSTTQRHRLELQQTVEEVILFFEAGTNLKPESLQELDQVADQLKGLDWLATEMEQTWRISVVGHTDTKGREDDNLVLSRQRAEVVATELSKRGVPHAAIRARGVGSTQPGAGAGAESDRRVTLEVHWNSDNTQ